MKKWMLLSTLILLSFTIEADAEEQKLGVTLDVTYLTKWLSKGAAAYGQQGALFKTVDIDLYGTGFGLKITHRNAMASGYVDEQRFDYRPYYKNQLFKDKPYATKCNLSVGYEHYPGLECDNANTTFEWVFAFSWPNILPEGFTPTYIAHYEYPAGSDYNYHNITGWVHRFILGYDFKIPELTNQVLHLSSEIAYTDGLGNKEHDWSYATFGLSIKFDISLNLSFCPGIYHQLSMEDSVNTHDVTYGRLSMRYKF